MCQHGAQGCCSVVGLRHGWRRTSASLGEDIPNISLSNIAFVALARMLLALLPSFAFLWLCNALPAAATVRSWIV